MRTTSRCTAFTSVLLAILAGACKRAEPSAAGEDAAIVAPVMTEAVPLDRATALCNVLDLRPPLPARSGPPWDDPHSRSRLVLAEGALSVLATIAARGGTIPCLDRVERALAERACEADVRCKDGRPLTSDVTSDHKEPPCTREELARAVTDAEEQTPRIPGPPRVGLFSLATLTAVGRVPEAFGKANARRRYRIVQAAKASCASEKGLALDMPCRCDEAELREAACRAYPDQAPGSAHCFFTVDDERRIIRGSVGTEPP